MIALATGTGLFAREPAPLTKLSVRSMPEQAVTQRLFGDLGRIMFPIYFRGQAGVRPTRPLRDLSFLTRPQASGHAGICAISTVTVSFMPIEPDRGAATAVRPSGITTQTSYFIFDFARMRRGGDISEREMRSLESACSEIDPRRRRAFTAGDLSQAARAIVLLDDLIRGVRAGRPVPTLQCEVMISPGETAHAACLREVSRLSAANASSAGPCYRPPTDISSCYAVSSDGFSIRFEFRGNDAAPSVIVAEPEIVVADLLID